VTFLVGKSPWPGINKKPSYLKRFGWDSRNGNRLNSACIPVKGVLGIIFIILVLCFTPTKKQREKKRIKKEVEKRLRLVLINVVSKAKTFDLVPID